MESPIAPLHLTFKGLERPRSSLFIRYTGAELGRMLLLNTNRKSYVENLTDSPLEFILGDSSSSWVTVKG